MASTDCFAQRISGCGGKDLPAHVGTYALLLHLKKPARLRIGKLGRFDFPAGWYLYVGSARGPGGLAARVGRHLRSPPKCHWQIDYLRRAALVEEVWWREGDERRECEWARAIGAWEGAEIVAPGFGASDCGCAAHLWRTGERRVLAELGRGETMILTSKRTQRFVV